MGEGKLKGVFAKAKAKDETLLREDLLEALEEPTSTIANVTDCMMAAKGLVSFPGLRNTAHESRVP